METEVNENNVFTREYLDKMQQKEQQREDTLMASLFNEKIGVQDRDKSLENNLFNNTVVNGASGSVADSFHGDMSFMMLVIPLVVGGIVAFILKRNLRRVHSAKFDDEVL